MEFFFSLPWYWQVVAGILIGWLIEWVIDWWYWRRQWEAPWRARVSEADSARARLQIQYDGVQTELDPLKADLARVNDLNVRLEADLNKLRAQLETSERQVVALTTDLNACREARAKLETEAAQFKTQLGEREVKIGSLTTDLTTVGEARSKLQAELESLRAKSTAKETEHTGLLDKIKAELAEKLTALAGAVALTTQLRGDVETNAKRAESAEAELGAVRRQLNERSTRFDSDLGSLTLRADGAEAELARLRADLKANQDYSANLERDLAKLKADVTEKTGLLAGSETLNAQLRGELDQHRSRADVAEGGLGGLRAELAEKLNLLAAAEAMTGQLRGDVSAQQSRAAGLEAELNSLRGQSAPSAELDDLRLQLAESRYANNGTLAELAGVRAQLLDCQRQSAELESELHDAIVEVKAAAPATATRSRGIEVMAAAPGVAEFDDFEPINGIGPVFERRLYDAGITTYEQLADTPAERIIAIVRAKSWQAVDADFWRRQARDLAEAKRSGALQTARKGDDLKVINGIGPVFERRLNGAGIYTFAELADTTNERIVEIVKAKSWQAVDADFWRRQARDLAAKK